MLREFVTLLGVKNIMHRFYMSALFVNGPPPPDHHCTRDTIQILLLLLWRYASLAAYYYQARSIACPANPVKVSRFFAAVPLPYVYHHILSWMNWTTRREGRKVLGRALGITGNGNNSKKWSIAHTTKAVKQMKWRKKYLCKARKKCWLFFHTFNSYP